jgi:subtilisin family serine protease
VTPPISRTSALNQIRLSDLDPRVDPQIGLDLAESSDGRTDFFVFLSEQANLSPAYTISDWNERGWFVYRTLVATAERSQRDLRAQLDDQSIPYEPFWIINALLVHGDASDVQMLEEHEDVALLRANHTLSLNPPEIQPAATMTCFPNVNGVCWNVRAINADNVWYDFGISGEGITVANIDSGVQYAHPALIEQYRGYRSTNNVQHQYNWYDPVSQTVVAGDDHGHGTHTMGTMVARGDGSSDQPAVGVAPGATWIAARGCGSKVCTESNIIEAAEWLLAPRDKNGKNPRPDLRPHIINNSWASSEGNETQHADYINAWRAAGIFPVFVNGNDSTGAKCGSVASPGDYANVMSVGALDRENTLAYFSRLGPTSDGRTKPDISAPGLSITSTNTNLSVGYRIMSGTSMAAPHVGGTVALIWSANPTLIGDYERTYDILTQSAEPITSSLTHISDTRCSTDTVPNNVYGYGRLDAYQAVRQARVDVPWLRIPSHVETLQPGEVTTITLTLDTRKVAQPGEYQARVLVGTGDLLVTPLNVDIAMTVFPTNNIGVLHGTVRDIATGDTLNAQVEVRDGPQVEVDDAGEFDIMVPAYTTPHTYTISARASGYLEETRLVSITSGIQRIVDFTLAAKNSGLNVQSTSDTTTLEFQDQATRLITISNMGFAPLEYDIEVLQEHMGVWRSDEEEVPYSWISMPPDAPVLSLQDDTTSDPIPLGFTFPFATRVFTEVRVNSNGVIILGKTNDVDKFKPRCPPIPVPETTEGALFPLRADFNPGQGGTIRYARTGQGMVITFDKVPLFDKPSQIFTFQVLLTPEGNVRFTYKNISDIPSNASAGVQFWQNEPSQIIGCGINTPLSDRLLLELRPQPDTRTWIEVKGSSSGSIPTEDQVVIPVEVAWASHFYQKPYKGVVKIESNDLYHPSEQVSIYMNPEDPPYTLWVPLVAQSDSSDSDDEDT